MKQFTLGIIVGIILMALLAPLVVHKPHQDKIIWEDQTWAWRTR